MHCVRERDYDGAVVHRHFSDRLDAAEYRLIIRRRRERYDAGLELIPEPVTFGEYAREWLEARKKTLPHSTWWKDEQRLKQTWLPVFDGKKLQRILPPDIERILDGLIAKGNSPATRNRHRSLLHNIFEEAKREFPPLVQINPVASIRRLPENWRDRELETLTEDEIARYCEAAWGVTIGARPGAPWGILATILCWSGVRISEALALRWKDVSPNEIHVHRLLEVSTGVIRQRTKGKGAYHALYLPPVASAIARHGRRGPEELVAQGLDYWTARKLHKRTLRLAKLPRGIGIHALRHSFARLALKTGMRRDEIKDMLGHRSVQTTERYAPADTERVAKRARDLGFGVKRPKREKL